VPKIVASTAAYLKKDKKRLFMSTMFYPSNMPGKTTFANLALACVSCSLHKAAKQTASDPETGKEAPLFNPRKSPWNLHF
jgi:hypothetical protein